MFKDIEDRKDISQLYKSVKIQLGWNTNGPPKTLLVDGAMTSSSQKMADSQMKYYTMKNNKLMNNLVAGGPEPTSWLEEAMRQWGHRERQRPVFEFQDVTLADTNTLIKTLGNSSAFGFDEFDAKTIKAVASHILLPIQHLINLSLNTSKFASKWKIGRIIPLFKGKNLDILQSSSYRPVSMLPLVSKLVERAAQQQMLRFLDNTNQLNNNSNAYRKGYNTTTALHQITDRIHEATDINTIANVMTIDESSTLDCISHDTMDKKTGYIQFWNRH